MEGSAYATAQELNTFTHVGGLTPQDYERLQRLGPHLRPLLPELTDRFYQQLSTDPLTAPHVEGRLEQLKITHLKWLEELFAGNYGPEFIARQEQIGRVHVLAKIPPLFVAASMSFLRSEIPKVIQHCTTCGPEIQTCSQCVAAVLRLLDLCQFLIDRAYEEDRMDRLTLATGMSRKLLEALVMLKPRAD